MTTKSYPTINDVRHAVNAQIAAMMAERTARATALSHRYGELWSVISAYMDNSGKRVRPYLTVLAYSLYGGGDHERITMVATAQELLSQALLIHDDIIDRDFVRYGKPNISGALREYYVTTHNLPTEQAVHGATSAALMAGDLAIAESFALIRQSGFSDAQVLALQDFLQEGIFAVAGGEVLDSETMVGSLDTAEPLVVARLKTALYSITVPLLCGAYLADAPKKDMSVIRELGECIGIAYQLVDDMLGVFGDESVTGKTTLGDLREGKQTYIMQQTWRHATTADRALVRGYFGKHDLTAEQAAILRMIIDRSGARQLVQQKIDALVANAMTLINQLQLPNAGRAALRETVVMITKRNA